MYFYFDESGDFLIPSDSREHRVAVVAGIAVSDLVHKELSSRFQQFESSLNDEEREAGEAKGSLLTDEHLEEFSDMLAGLDGISLTPVTLDLSHITGHGQEKMNEQMHDIIFSWAEKMLYPKAREALELLARQFRNLSSQQAVRMYSLAYCVREALQHAFIFLTSRGHEQAWGDVRLEFDRVQTKPGSREEMVFSGVLFSWLVGWSKVEPFAFVEEIHVPGHPLREKYDTGKGIDIGKLMGGRIHWVDSKDSWGVRIADIAANIVYRASMATDDRKGAVTRFASLMRSSYYGHVRGPGLFTPLGDMPSDVSGKYLLLSEAMKRRSEE